VVRREEVKRETLKVRKEREEGDSGGKGVGCF
jgi:hypothetical protein